MFPLTDNPSLIENDDLPFGRHLDRRKDDVDVGFEARLQGRDHAALVCRFQRQADQAGDPDLAAEAALAPLGRAQARRGKPETLQEGSVLHAVRIRVMAGLQSTAAKRQRAKGVKPCPEPLYRRYPLISPPRGGAGRAA